MINLQPQQFVTWEEPIEMLYACHGKVKQFCCQLQILPDYIEQNGCNQAVKNDVQQILNYFNKSAPLHHDDEEKDFFPALVQEVPAVQLTIDLLESQHQLLNQSWCELSAELTNLLNDSVSNVNRELIRSFVERYHEHIALEEPLFELGREYLVQTELQNIGKIMAERRKANGLSA